MFLNDGVAQIFLMLLGPLLYFAKPLIPRKATDIIWVITNISLHYLLYTLLADFNFNLIELLNETVILK